jgi:hypothetical protein
VVTWRKRKGGYIDREWERRRGERKTKKKDREEKGTKRRS